MHTPINGFWDDEKIAYYDIASRDCSFHSLIASEIAKHLSKDEKIIELGAGLGYVTAILKANGFNIKAYDNCESAVKSANRRVGFDLIGYADAFTFEENADVLLMFFFGGLSKKESLERFFRLSNKIIYIISAHTGYEGSKREDKSGKTEELFNSLGIDYEKAVISCEFNQPLRNLQDAKRFFQISYNCTLLPILEESKDKDYPLLFRNRKKIYMYTIKRRKEQC